jgi:phosphoenolpyruvate carboxykinase (GTP)
MSEFLQKLKTSLKEVEYNKIAKIKNREVHKFIVEAIDICTPKDVFVCSDTPDEIAYIKNMAVVSGEEKMLLLPGHTYHFDGINDQGRDRSVTKLLVPEGDKLSKKLNQIAREEGLREVLSLLKDSMQGKTMIVRFLTLGPLNSIFSIPCVECTDSWYVAHSVDLLYREGYRMFLSLPEEGVEIFKTLHSAGEVDENMVSKNYDKKRIYIDYITNTVYSVNTQYAGNSVGFKKLALRLAIRKAHKEGWLAEHFMLVGVKGPNNRKTYFAGAFPSGCGKTSTAMLPGETILADDLAYVRNIGGKARAVNVEKGIFGIIQDVNPKDDPLIWEVLNSPGEVIFTNVLVKDGRPWWLGMGCKIPDEGVNFAGYWYKGKKDANGEEVPPAHKNARYTVSLKALKNCDEELENTYGVELKGIMFGGRDYRSYVPVQQSFDWVHGVVAYGAALETETTFAIVEEEGKYEINVMSIQDFVSIPLGTYVKNYIEFGKKLIEPPIIFGVNYFLRDLRTGEFLNSRLDKHVWVKWMELRVHGDVKARETPTGLIPLYEDLAELFKSVLNKSYTKEDYVKQFTIRVPENIAKIGRVEHFWQQEENTPQEIFDTLRQQKERLLVAQKKFGDYIAPENLQIVW